MMVEREPSESKNLDIYGNPMIEWSQLRERFANEPLGEETPFFLGTVHPSGLPQSAGIGPVWHEGDFYFTSGPDSRKSKNLAQNPACTLSGRLPGYDVVVEGTAQRVTDRATIDRLAAIYHAGGWPAEATSEGFTAPYSAPSAGPPPWHLYRLTVNVIIALHIIEPGGAARWRFG
jgi:hypothetical protein